MAAFTKTLPGNNQVQVQYFWTQSELNAYSGPIFYDFQMNPGQPYYPTAAQLTCDRGPANCSAPPDLTAPITAFWSDPNNYRYSGNLNVEQRVVVTFSGSNGGWDYAATSTTARTPTTIVIPVAIPMKLCSKPPPASSTR